MAQEYYTILTNAGLAYEAQSKANQTPIRLTHLAVGDGDGAAYNPGQEATALRRETHRQEINALFQDEANPSWLLAEALLPDDVGGFTIREVGIYTDTGILYAIGKYPDSVKPILAQGSTKQFYVRAIFQTSNASIVTLVVDNNVVQATRAFVLDHVKSELEKLDHKNSVRVATTAAIVLSGTQNVDGIALGAGDRVLVKDQAAGATNGIYVVSGGAWTRAADADASIEVTPGMRVPVEHGIANADSVWQLATDGAIVLGTTVLVFEASSGLSGVAASTYRSVTVDKRGRVTGGTNPAELMALSRVTSLSVSSSIAANQMGLLLLDATAGARTFTLPAANAALGVVELVLRRVDVTSNALVIAANGTDTLMLDTTAEAAGQASTELLFAGDYLRLRSDGAGSWWCVGQAQLPGSIASGLVAYSVAGTFSYTVPPVLRSGRRRAKSTLRGGGGSGRSVSGTAANAGGGAAGGKSEKVVDLTGVASVSVTVGAGGAAVTPAAGSTASGNAGGTSSFGAYHSATGGAGGGSARAQGGIGIGGDINTSLGDSYTAQISTAVSKSVLPGGGAGGGSANIPDTATDGFAGTLPGAGGGGCLTTSGVAQSSGKGADGECRIEW